jgi:hypothetical protein
VPLQLNPAFNVFLATVHWAKSLLVEGAQFQPKLDPPPRPPPLLPPCQCGRTGGGKENRCWANVAQKL